MKLLFICGSIEPGRDGVGDYSRRLAGEIIRQGHQAGIIALNDKYVSEAIETTQLDEKTSIEILRLSAKLNNKDRFAQAKKFIQKHNPEWLSLQFVPFAYHNKGLPLGLAKQLKNLGNGYKWHIMFHELWVGMAKSDTLKLKAWGWVQTKIILNLIKQLKPQTIHTQTQLYKELLVKGGVKVEKLPLFGNIPLAQPNIISKELNKNINLMVFGNIHSGAPIDTFANELRFQSSNVSVTFIGRCGAEQELWKNAFVNKGIKVNILGEQNVIKISHSLSDANWGITSTPWLLIEKSGTVAAMLEHKLPVCCVAREWAVNESVKMNPKYIFQYLPGNLASLLSQKISVNETNSLKATTKLFLNSLNES